MTAKTILSLDKLKPGTKGHIHSFLHDDQLSDQLREMGFSEKLAIEIRHESIIGKDPMVVQVDAMIIALRRADAAYIKVAVAA